MTVFAYYLLKVVMCSGVLFLYYCLALRNKAFHQWNRFYLLSIIILSLIAPTLEFNITDHNVEKMDQTFHLVQTFDSVDSYLAVTVKKHPFISFDEWGLIIYITVSAVFLTGVLLSLRKIISIIQSHPVLWIEKIAFINTNVKGTPFSFLRFIFWNDNIDLHSQTGQQIFQHELVHVKEHHTLDKLFVQLIVVFFWCNPFFWLIQRELKLIHEFIADKKSVGQHGTAAFAAMILSASYSSRFHFLTNHFFQTSIKRRLAMLTQIQNPMVNYIMRILALPILAVTVFAFTLRIKNASLANPKTDMVAIPNKQSGKTRRDTLPEKNGTVSMEKAGIKTTVAPDLKLESKNTPLYLLDGKEVSKEEVDRIDPSTIQLINVLKDESAIKKYGDKAKNGVVEIRLKSEKNRDQIIVQADGEMIEKGSMKTDPSATKVNATFTGNILQNDTTRQASIDRLQWTGFLAQSLTPVIEEATKAGAPPGTYTAIIRFMVGQDGSLSDFEAFGDPGYGIGKKVLAIMNNSPKWEPAVQNGRKVNSYYTQSVVVVIPDMPLSEDERMARIPKVKVDDLKKWTRLNVEETVVRFDVVYLSDKSDKALKYHNLSPYFDETARTILGRLKPGALVSFEDIVIRQDGKEVKRRALIYEVVQ
jgi:hypothetical protein